MALVKFEAESERKRKVGFYCVASIAIRIDFINLDLICICFANTHYTTTYVDVIKQHKKKVGPSEEIGLKSAQVPQYTRLDVSWNLFQLVVICLFSSSIFSMFSLLSSKDP